MRYMRWYSLCGCVRSTPITATTSTVTLFSTLFHSLQLITLLRSISTPHQGASFSSNIISMRLFTHFPAARAERKDALILAISTILSVRPLR